jgi:hypothetical protein
MLVRKVETWSHGGRVAGVRGKGKPTQLADAIEQECANDLGQLTRAVGRVIEFLCVSGVMSKEEALTFLPGYEEVPIR